MSMKEAFDIFFQKRDKFYEKYRDVDLPIPMKPVLQSAPIDFTEIEDKLGFKIHPSIKEYLSTYWFDEIEGFFNNRYINIKGVQKIEAIYNDVIIGFSIGEEHFLKDSPYWYIGGCDPYSMFVNNTTGEVTAVITYERKSIHLSDSISELITNIKCELDS